MDSLSLDAAIQHALAGLYPPFEATAATVLGQVFRLLDSDFRGDGLSLLLDFLIPAKRLCERVREAACAPYAHRVFLHEGWPLCLHGAVVVHLAPLSPLLLREGDFFLQAEPREEQSVCLAVKCLSADLRTVDTRPVPECSYSELFTQAWLGALNSASEGRRLRSCLVASAHGVARMPWTKITSPEFVDHSPPVENVPSSPAWASLQLEALDLSNPRELLEARTPNRQGLQTPGNSGTWGIKYPRLIKVEQSRPGQGALTVDCAASQDLEGDYVGLLELSPGSSRASPQREVGTSSGHPQAAPGELRGTEGVSLPRRVLPPAGAGGAPPLDKCVSGQPGSLEQKPPAWGLPGKLDPEGPAGGPETQAHLSGPESPSPWASDSSCEPAAVRTQGPKQTSSPLCPARPPAAPATAARVTGRSPPAHGRLPGPAPSSPAPPSPGHRFSLLRGQRPAPEGPGEAPPCRVLCPGSEPEPSGDKQQGKAGTTQTQTSGPDADSGPPLWEKAGLPEASAGPLGRAPALDLQPPGPELGIAALSAEILSSRIACLPGGRDRQGRPLLLISAMAGAWDAPWCTVSEVAKLLSYLCTVPRLQDKTTELVLVMDAREQPPPAGLVSALQATQAGLPASIRAASLLFLGEKEAALPLQRLPGLQVEVLTSLKALSRHVDPSQLPPALDGPFPYCHSEWVRFFQKLDPFLADLRQASSLLQASIEAFEKGDPPGGVQEASWRLSQSKERMAAVLRDPGLHGLQREGGATLARLQQEAGRLPLHPDVRSQMAGAAALYELVEEQLHVLVTVSNQVLRRLELRVRLGCLQAAVHQVSHWMEQEGSRRLQALSPGDGSLEAVERAQAEFEDFFLQAVAQYRRGLELSKQAAQLGMAAQGPGEAGVAEFPELAALAETQSSFQAKLTHFYMAAERRRTDLDTLLSLHRFCKKMAWFHTDCQDLTTQLGLGRDQRASPGDQRRLHRYLQRLASEFPAEKLAAVGLQAASLSWAHLGQELWAEAQRTHAAIRTLLEKASAHCPSPAGPPAPSARPELRGPVARTPGRWGLPLQDKLGVQRSPKACWPPRGPSAGQSRNFRAGTPPWEAGQWAEADEAPEHVLATLLSWLRPLRRGHGPHPTRGSSFSSGTDSQTSLEDSPQTSPPASL
ncbi:uncharacterized protein KIAA1755 homolog [Sorex araneus]|uniref:uncharacterized protein KIAA1755 homolog n=1 Tax=Sorex araneus TaxID=42254 RepID=UPI0024339C2F|nr:uncharacterized protein KIAA1755 homolog [Sorex araneus]